MRISDWSSDVCSSDLVLGFVWALVLAGIIIALLVVAGNTVTTDNAEVGMCINVDEEDDENTVHLNKKDCSDDHDAEIALVSTYGDVEGKINPLEINQGATEETEAAAVCRRSDERRVGKGCVRTCRTRWSP